MSTGAVGSAPQDYSASRGSDTDLRYSRPANASEALQVAIRRWIEFEYSIWEQTQQESSNRLGLWSSVLRVTIITLAASVTVMADIEVVPRTTITVVSGVLTALAGTEGYLKLADRRTTADNRKRELLAERDRLKQEWTAKVELEVDDDKALAKAKEFLESGPKLVNDIVAKYISRASESAPQKPS